jgi:hypothetical protein
VKPNEQPYRNNGNHPVFRPPLPIQHNLDAVPLRLVEYTVLSINARAPERLVLDIGKRIKIIEQIVRLGLKAVGVWAENHPDRSRLMV